MVNAYGYVTGGADRHCFALARALRERGHEVCFMVSASRQNEVDDAWTVPLLVTSSIRDSLGTRARARVLGRAVWNRDAASRMRSLTEGFRPDVVHAHKLYPQLSVSPIRVAAVAGIPVVQTLHDYELMSASARDHEGGRFDRDESKASYRALNNLTFPLRRSVHRRSVSEWIAVSHFVAARYAAAGIDAHVLKNFVEASDAPLPVLEERTGIVFAATLAPDKGVEDVIELARLAPATKVTIAGAGHLEDLARRAASELENLDYRGFLSADELGELVRSSRAAVVPSHWEEPGGLSALEAMAAGTPVVAYRSGGLAEYVDEAGGGCVVERSPAAMLGALAELEDPETWRALSLAGRTAVSERHGIDGYIDRIEEIYGRAIREAPTITA